VKYRITGLARCVLCFIDASTPFPNAVILTSRLWHRQSVSAVQPAGNRQLTGSCQVVAPAAKRSWFAERPAV
jgi:hypothetical protein